MNLNDARWASVVARDAAADGKFYYSVKTTGVYCRPSCAARLARPENVEFHATPEDAEAAGFRPCKRCKPDQGPLAAEHAARIAAACRFIESSDESPDLKTLAARAGMSRYHFHRVFKSLTGVTPKKYAAGERARRMREALDESGSVTEAIYDAGFSSSGRFYAGSNEALGMTPTAFRKGGEKAEIRFAVGETALGALLVARSERGLCAILLGDNPEALAQDLAERFPKARLIAGDEEFEATVARVADFVEAPSTGLDLPLDIRGTAFQLRVWQALRRIPAGRTASYGEIAALIGAPAAARAVARACASNRLAVAVPCHRVVGGDGRLAGYRWGTERKRELLAREGASPGPYSPPRPDALRP